MKADEAADTFLRARHSATLKKHKSQILPRNNALVLRNRWLNGVHTETYQLPLCQGAFAEELEVNDQPDFCRLLRVVGEEILLPWCPEPRNIGVDRIALATVNNTARQQDQDEEDRKRGGKRKT